ncbi:MAG: hypothetical protein RLW87_20665 [Alphaproteobacteria bacterium]
MTRRIEDTTVAEEAKRIIDRQTEKGLAKYGVTLDDADIDADIDAETLIQEKACEFAVGLQYAIAALRAVRDMRARIAELEQKVADLEAENARLRGAEEESAE